MSKDLPFATDLMGNFERSGMATSQARERRWVVAAGIGA